MPRVELVVNPCARRLAEGAPLRRRLAAEAEGRGALVHAPADLDALTDLARAIASRHPDVVLLAGGDGTLMRGLSALVKAFDRAPLPLVGVLPAGTVGTVARSLGLRGPASARAVLRTAFAPKPTVRAVRTLRVRSDGGGRQGLDRAMVAPTAVTGRADVSPAPPGDHGPAADHVGFIFGAGLVARFFDVYGRQRRPGRAAAAVIASRVFVGSFIGADLARRILGRTACHVTVDGEEHPAGAWTLLVASRVADLGLHFRVTYRGAEDPERFHVIGSGLPARALGPQVFRVLAGRPLRGEPRIDALARSLRVRFEDAPGAYVVDGDVFTGTEVRVENGPVVRVLVGPEAMGGRRSNDTRSAASLADFDR